MKYKATKDFQKLGIDNSYQGLETRQYFDLREGKEVEIKQVPIPLIEGKFIEEVKIKKTDKISKEKSWQ